MRIEALHLRDIGPFRDTTLVFPEGTDPERADVHLLVGENGTGKTAVLRALAAAFDASVLEDLVRRFTSEDGLIAVRWTGGTFGFGRRFGDIERPLPSLFASVGCLGGTVVPVGYPTYEDENAHSAFNLSRTSSWDPQADGHSLPSFVALSLGSYRQASSDGVVGTRQIHSNPLRCWSEQGVPTGRVETAQWLVNTRVRASTSRDEADSAEAARFESYLHAVESALSEMIGKPTRIRVPSKTLDARLEIDGRIIPLDLLPDGLRAILAWVADVFMRLERIPDAAQRPIDQREFALLLDEVEVHLHPRWQRRVLHTFQSLFPKAQVFASTHSPFVVNSVSDAWIHSLQLDSAGNVSAEEPERANPGSSIQAILGEVLGVREEFGEDVEPELQRLKELRDRRLGGDSSVQGDLDRLAVELREFGDEVGRLVEYHLRVLQRRLAEGA